MFSDERSARIDHYDTLELDGLIALERDRPRDVDLLVMIGRHSFRQRKLDQSHRYYSRALAIDPDDGWTHLYMGNLCYAVACYDEAVAHFRQAMDLMPEIGCPHWCLADAYDKQGYWSRTEYHYRKAVELDPSDETAKRKLDKWLAEKVEIDLAGDSSTTDAGIGD